MKMSTRILMFGLLLLLASSAAFAMTVQEAKVLPDTGPVTLTGKVVTYAGTGFFYIEEDSRAMGIRVEKSGHNLAVGMRADISGEMATNPANNERYVLASTAVQSAPPGETGAIDPVSMNGKALGGSDWSVSGTGGQKGTTNKGLNNIGLLVKVFGQYSKTGETSFTLNDGSGPVLCTAPAGTFLSTAWQSVVVTGIVSLYESTGTYPPLILVRDIQVVEPAEAVSAPGTPSGNTSPTINQSYTYSTTGAACNWGHNVEYQFNWGDGSSSAWSTSASASHTWTDTTARTVTVTARCQSNSSLTATSAGLAVTPVMPTEAVSTPGTPSGDSGPLVNLPYTYATTGAACNWGHAVEYRFSWGDGTFSSWSTSTSASHTWTSTTARTVTVTARCQTNPGLTATSAGLVVTPVTQVASAPWQMFRRDAKRMGFSSLHDPTAVLTPWTYTMGNGLSSPAVAADGTIYLAGSGALYALNANGTYKWSAALNNSPRSSPAIGSDGTIYIGGNARVYAINSNGTQKWSYSVSGDVSGSPVVGPNPDASGDMVYIGTRGGVLYALTPGTSSATSKWTYSVGDMHITSPVLSSDGSTVFAAGGSGSLVALRTAQAATRLKWSSTLPKTYTTPALNADGTKIYAGSGDGNLYCYNTSDGGFNWLTQVGFKAAVTSASPAVGPDGTVYIGSNYGTLYAINPTDGTYSWIFESRAGDIRASAAVNADNTVVFVTYDEPCYVRGLDGATGAEKWHHVLPGTNYGSPAILANGAVAVPTMSEGKLYCGIWGTPPAAVPPSGLTATVPGGAPTTANLIWSDNSADEYGFRVERRMGTIGAFSTLATVAAGTTTYTDTGLISGMIYYYRVCAYQSGGDSAYSNEAYAETPGLKTPVGLIGDLVSSAQVDLFWTDRADNELGFKIERSQGPNGLFQEIAQVGADVVTYSDTSVYPSTDYSYRVRAFNAIEDSSYCPNEVLIQTPGRDFGDITRGNTSRAQVALTFDAGTAGMISSIPTTLRTNGVYSTFFITGYVTSVQASKVAELATYGQHICNHTYDHPDLKYCTDQQIWDQMNSTDDIIYAKSGNRTRWFFRAPYGARNQHVIDATAEIGFRHVGWSKDSGDVGGASPSSIVSAITSNPLNGDVDLFHCTQTNTASALQSVIDALKAKGFEMVSMPELVAPLQVTSPVGTLRAGWNLISLPIVPALEFPHVVFKGLTMDNYLKRWDRTAGAEVVYTWATKTTFGNVYADEGYWVYVASPTTFKYNGAAATTARRVRLQYTATPGNHATYGLIGCPFQTARDLANCQIYNPNAAEPKTRSVADAITAGWIPSYFYGWNNSTQSEFSVSIPAYSPVSTQLQPWAGYRAACLVPGCELIIPMP